MNLLKDPIRPFIILSSNGHSDKHILAYGADKYIMMNVDDGDPFEELKSFIDDCDSPVFGYFSYDLKNVIEDLESKNPDELEFPDMFFFMPSVLKEFTSHEELEEYVLTHFGPKEDQNNFLLESRTSREDYLKNIKVIKDHIQRGDIYELNYCVEFFGEGVTIDPLTRFLKLNEFNSAPFSSYLSFNGLHLMCGSPERYLRRKGNKIISQPIKGTIKRGVNFEEDEEFKRILQNDPKERSENVMITDLVRNDLSRTAKRGSVKVKELCGLYSFKTVHQLISTIESEVDDTVSTVDVIKNSFPMGSMTGAPKISAMKIIEEVENFKRGLYSGSIGYIDNNGDCDFNVVIRSLFYNESKSYVSARVGGAITSKSEPIKEYEECLLKAESLKKTMS